MSRREITLILLALILILPLLISCTKALQDKMADSVIDKMIGNKPKEIEVEPVDFYLSYTMKLIYKNGLPAYPLNVGFSAHRELKNGKWGENFQIDKQTRGDGMLPRVEFIFKRVYPEDVIISEVFCYPSQDRRDFRITGIEIIGKAGDKKAYYQEVNETMILRNVLK